MFKHNKTIVLVVFNRPDKTLQTLQALEKIHSVSDFNLLVIRQEGSAEVKEIIDDIAWIAVEHHVTDYSVDKSVKFRINNNVRTGLEIAFSSDSCDYAVVVEDDILLGYDFLHFCEVMHDRYATDKEFRAINAFSKEQYDPKLLWSFGKFRYGIGKGWSISRPAWNQLATYWEPGIDQHFDYLIEGWTRSGFVLMPYCSRSLDIGWGEGSSHGPKDEFDEHWVAMRKSWVGCDPFPLENYQYVENLQFSWREDCVSYRNNFEQKFDLFKWKFKKFARKLLKK